MCYAVQSFFTWSYLPVATERLHKMGKVHDFTTSRKEGIYINGKKLKDQNSTGRKEVYGEREKTSIRCIGITY